LKSRGEEESAANELTPKPQVGTRRSTYYFKNTISLEYTVLLNKL